MHENLEVLEQALLVAVDTGEYDVNASMAELEELARSAGIEALAQVVQRRGEPDQATCIGAGKLREVADFIQASQANLLIFDQELSATQLRNIEKICDVAVIDRTMLILEIFARRANTSEGRLQVELARSRYLLPRLAGMGKSLSRLGGGGSGGGGARRGKGETMLELDRRHIRKRIQTLERQMEQLQKRRDQRWERRKKDGITSIAIVGYTNVGKSTLLGALTNAKVLAEDKLFATLDPSARALKLPDGRKVMLVDTVGLVRRLPHHLVEAFHSTLEEAVHADLLLNVCDISSEDAQEQIQVTNQLLRQLGAGQVPVLTVLNKSDQMSQIPLALGENIAIISARTGFGIPQLLEKAAAMLDSPLRRMRLLIPYGQEHILAEIRDRGTVLEERFTHRGTLVEAMVDRRLWNKVRPFLQTGRDLEDPLGN